MSNEQAYRDSGNSPRPQDEETFRGSTLIKEVILIYTRLSDFVWSEIETVR